MPAQSIPAEHPVNVIRQYIDAFNKGDAKSMAACFADTASVLVQREYEGKFSPKGREIPPFGRGFSRHEDLSVRCVR